MAQPGLIAITGADGFLGSALVERLHAAGRAVRRIQRSAGPDARRWDLLESPPADLLAGVDTLIHCAARAHVLRDGERNALGVFRQINRDATIALADAALASGVRRMIFVSTVGVNGQATDGRPFRADGPPAPTSPYAIAKWEAEQALQSHAARGLEIVIVRPPLIIGRGAKGNIGLIARLVRAGLPLPFGALDGNRRDLVSLPVLVDFIVTCIDHPDAPTQTWLVADGRTRSTSDIVRAVACSESAQARFWLVPEFVLSAALRWSGRAGMAQQLLGDLEIDDDPTRTTLGWQPPAEGIY